MGADAPTRAAIEAVWRVEAARLIGGLVRFTRDVDRAEDLAHDALVIALERWPETGIPANPGAWLMTTARHRAIDDGRRRTMMAAKHDEIAHTAAPWAPLDKAAIDEVLDDAVGDDVLRLMLISCHPVLSREARIALTLRLVAGLSTAEIARAFLTTEVTLAQRIVRAKRTLAEAKVPFEVPTGDDLRARIPPTLEAIYLIFNEGYAATAGDDWLRPALCDEALRLGRTLAELAPDLAEVHGLVALMEIQASRLAARVDAQGQAILLADQNRARWDHLLIRRGLAALDRAEALHQPVGNYRLQAEIAACHARAPSAHATDWARIAALYAELMRVAPSPVVELNRAVAVSMAQGPAAGLAVLEALLGDKALRHYHWLPAVQGDLLHKLGRADEARAAFLRAAELAGNERERAVLLARAQAPQ